MKEMPANRTPCLSRLLLLLCFLYVLLVHALNLCLPSRDILLMKYMF